MKERDSSRAIELLRGLPGVDGLSLQALFALRRVGHGMVAALEKHFERYHLSRTRFGVLVTLFMDEGDRLSPAELADEMGVTRATMTSTLDALERDKLIQREPHPNDRRMLSVTLTPRGRSCIERVMPDHYRRATEVMKNLTFEERQQLADLLGKVEAGIPALLEA